MVSHIKQNIYHEIINHYEPYITKNMRIDNKIVIILSLTLKMKKQFNKFPYRLKHYTGLSTLYRAINKG